MDWQLVASYFTVKSTDIFFTVCILEDKTSSWSNFVLYSLTRFTARGKNKILILRQRNLSKQCLLRYLCLNIKIPPPHVPQAHFQDHNKKMDMQNLCPLEYIIRTVQPAQQYMYTLSLRPFTKATALFSNLVDIIFETNIYLYRSIDIKIDNSCPTKLYLCHLIVIIARPVNVRR